MNPSGFYVDPKSLDFSPSLQPIQFLLNSLIFKKQNRKITTKEKGTVVNQDYRSSFIESRTDDVMKLRMT
ncbi:hypothetical protein [Bacteroides stercoris]|uniref:hypothetical protein n=1 Tax=Bacteroides stercoris TaxID=46506 RepID=UPI0034A37FF8